jgi:hypothetical protein
MGVSEQDGGRDSTNERFLGPTFAKEAGPQSPEAGQFPCCRGYFPPPPHDRSRFSSEQGLMIALGSARIAQCTAVPAPGLWRRLQRIEVLTHAVEVSDGPEDLACPPPGFSSDAAVLLADKIYALLFFCGATQSSTLRPLSQSLEGQ